MANISSYNQLSSWNEDDDLLFVQQPDAPKKAHPSQMKEYVEAGDFEATGEVKDGHGNILAKKADITNVTIPVFTPSEAGWRRICKITSVGSATTVEGMIHVGGNWSNGQPSSALIAVNIMHSAASLTLLSSAVRDGGRITDMRLIYISGANYWLDVYFPAYSSGTGPHKLTFTGDILVSDIQNPISITTDATAATDEVSLNQKVNGTVLTDKSVDNAISYKAGDVIANENIIAAAMAYNASDCYFTMPLSKPVVASSVSISDIRCTVYWGTNQRELVSGATFTGAIQPGSILIKMTKANSFTENARYVIDFKGTFTFS